MSAYEDIYRIVCQIPRGKVATYGQIALLAGLAGQARLVGYALHALKPDSSVPWQRVINASGRISSFGDTQSLEFQRAILVSEGVCVSPKGWIDLEKFRWRE